MSAYDAFTGRSVVRSLPDQSSPVVKEVVVKELSLEEVMRIAGGVPLSAALDEVTYRAPEEGVNDPIDYAHLLGAASRPTESA